MFKDILECLNRLNRDFPKASIARITIDRSLDPWTINSLIEELGFQIRKEEANKDGPKICPPQKAKINTTWALNYGQEPVAIEQFTQTIRHIDDNRPNR